MGKTKTHCLISGCTPESASELQQYDEYFDWKYGEELDEEWVELDDTDDAQLGPLVLQAIRELAKDEEGIDNVTVIGDFVKAKERLIEVTTPRGEALETPDSAITLRDNCSCNGPVDWIYGLVRPPVMKDDFDNYSVSVGLLVMVQDFALPILHLATRGRVTPQRLWRLAMHQGHSDMTGAGWKGLDDIDYGENDKEMRAQSDITYIPHMRCKEVKALEGLGDVQMIKDAIVHRGGYWMWMRADRFPLDVVCDQSALSFTSLDVPLSSSNTPAIAKLPLELLHIIARECSLTSLLSLASTSRTTRSMLMGSEPNRNALATAWIMWSAPWFAPATSDTEPRYEMDKVQDAWAYLQRCRANASMRNRARIWKIAEQIEVVAEQSGV
ncbi:hypothetical protein CONPUDRAFT_137655 [Coniophora puteana RWD-64-598 SS2]|uniref:F-box domain-containing protein n=1 Tax=Coniophora puteana (strain RWD-64-598) TaxID=741705 RepID=A0A5M3MNY9_CONPW|nr:uncharacterized protein CONPUDRAFT_137655 [Coniophora puteana RWD-64-598 SS2]EIW80455.1 hypothetical protein CONPUDRAFT_137655 [Coniophora puteana RWD-64-598 SS2]